MTDLPERTATYEIVAIGASQGGLNALTTILSGLPASFAVPVVIVQHRVSDPHGELADFLQGYSALSVAEAEDKQPVVSGKVFLAPADYHLLVEERHFALSTEAPVHSARPSIDVFFESIADTFGARAVGVILTGASHDGARGLARIKQSGGLTIVQAPETAESRLMPEAAIAAGPVDHLLPLDHITALLTRLSSA